MRKNKPSFHCCIKDGVWTPIIGHCDNCDTPFCSDHGTLGGDVQVEDVGTVARPSLCWQCGGFNADA